MSPPPADATAVALPRPARGPRLGSAALLRGSVVTWLSVIVLLPLAALVSRSFDDGLSGFWDAATSPGALTALKLTLGASAIVVAINVVAGTAIAWVLVRDEFPGKRFVNALIDLPFALPTVVAGLTLLTLYGPNSPVGIHAAVTFAGIVMALLFVTLPFVVRAVQPTLLELDRDMEEAAASLGANRFTVFRRIVLPNLAPAIFAGATLAFARAVGEFGSVVIIAGGAFKLQTSSIYIFNQIQFNNYTGAAAVSVLLLAISLLILLAIGVFSRRSLKYER
jgi:sulfate transport system permease protein